MHLLTKAFSTNGPDALVMLMSSATPCHSTEYSAIAFGDILLPITQFPVFVVKQYTFLRSRTFLPARIALSINSLFSNVVVLKSLCMSSHKDLNLNRKTLPPSLTCGFPCHFVFKQLSCPYLLPYLSTAIPYPNFGLLLFPPIHARAKPFTLGPPLNMVQCGNVVGVNQQAKKIIRQLPCSSFVTCASSGGIFGTSFVSIHVHPLLLWRTQKTPFFEPLHVVSLLQEKSSAFPKRWDTPSSFLSFVKKKTFLFIMQQ